MKSHTPGWRIPFGSFLLLCLLLAACKHSQGLQQPPTDAQIRHELLGSWTLDDRSNSQEYCMMVIRLDGSFATVLNDGTKRTREGTWQVDSGILRLITTNGVATPNGFRLHAISHVDDHTLVCGIDISMAGRLRFKR